MRYWIRGMEARSPAKLRQRAAQLLTMAEMIELGDLSAYTPKILDHPIIKVVSEYCHVSPRQILGQGRTDRVVHARQIAMWLFRQRNSKQMSYPRLGELFDRDHTTAIYNVDIITRRAAERSEYAAMLRSLEARVREIESAGIEKI